MGAASWLPQRPPLRPPLRVAFYPPFKPLGHPHPSGDLVIATGLVNYLRCQGVQVEVPAALRTRWIYRRPQLWLRALVHYRRALRCCRRWRPHLWLTYHSYYKAPDLLGPGVCRRLGIPYLLFQGIYATKRRRRLGTVAGFYLNRRALLAAEHLFTNRRLDEVNLLRLRARERISYVPPGIFPQEFVRDEAAGRCLRREWGAGSQAVVLSAAMFRRDVKTEGLLWLIACLGALARSGLSFVLVIAGDGPCREEVVAAGHRHLHGRVRFVGRVPRAEMAAFYSAGDLFAFPGIRESLGMVYLEAQASGLPVVAFENGGIPEVVAQGESGFLTPLFDKGAFADRVAVLIRDEALRTRMGGMAARRVRERHDLGKNYAQVLTALERIHAQRR
ncbi:MAG: glycosyltransferase family 4 protein [Desulfosarcinaceae bacterium]